MQKRMHRHLEGTFEHHLFEVAPRNRAHAGYLLRFYSLSYLVREPLRHVPERLPPSWTSAALPLAPLEPGEG